MTFWRLQVRDPNEVAGRESKGKKQSQILHIDWKFSAKNLGCQVTVYIMALWYLGSHSQGRSAKPCVVKRTRHPQKEKAAEVI